jgi:hypothetical protein
VLAVSLLVERRGIGALPIKGMSFLRQITLRGTHKLSTAENICGLTTSNTTSLDRRTYKNGYDFSEISCALHLDHAQH